jgi:FAD/FMN-containing dehydrogenase
VTNDAVQNLTAGLRGSLITPDSDSYEEARHIWNGMIEKRPALIVRCAGVADVIEAVAFAREQELAVAIRGGGHHVAGGSLNDGGLVIDLSLMRSVRVDPANRTVRAEGGATIGDLDRETGAFDLAVPMGLVSKTGIGGLTLAGGLGWLRRKHGLSSDNLISADVVTADGRLVKASPSENADLFWALRGGGWDMGVVTSFEFQAHPLPPEMYVSFTAFPFAEARTVLSRLGEYGRTAPDEVSPVAVIWTFPNEGEAFPPEVHGQEFVGVLAPYAGDPAEGERVTQPLRELATPLLDMSGPMPYALGVQRLFDEDYPDGQRYYWKSTYLRDLDEKAIDTLIELGGRRPTPITSLDIWMLGGALGRVGAQETPVGHREAAYLIGIEANWGDPSLDAQAIAWTRETEAALAPFSTGGSYLNFEDLSETKALAASHGANFQRLVEIKRKYDPANLFRSRRGLVD